MKKFIAILAGVLAFAAVASAQPRAIGLRAGYAPVGEISYQHGLGTNFVEVDFGGYYGLHVVGVYDFVFANANIFNFYVGPGALLGLYDAADSWKFDAGIVGQLGVEAAIPSVPINISLDWRPTIISATGTHWDGIALGIRYRF